jgi:DNA polymerase-3 subunit delta
VPFLVSYGTENFHLDREIEHARKWPKREAILVDGEDIKEGELLSLLDTVSYDGPRTIIIDNAQKVKLGKSMKAWLEEKTPDMSTILLAVVRSDKLPAGWASLGEKGESSEARGFKPWQTDQVVRWIETEATRLGVSLAPEVAKTLLRYVDVDLYRLSNELNKLAIFVGPEGTIAREHLDLIVSKTPGATVFQVAESAIAKNAQAAMNLFSILFKTEGADCLVPVTSALMRQVEKALIVRRMVDKGVDADIVAAAVGLDAKKYPYRQLSEHAAKHSSKELIRYMGQLCRLDVDVKSAASSKRTLVELAILSIAR